MGRQCVVLAQGQKHGRVIVAGQRRGISYKGNNNENGEKDSSMKETKVISVAQSEPARLSTDFQTFIKKLE